MIESKGWPHNDDLFGGREIGQSDQVSFLILVVPRLLPRQRRSSAEWRRSTRSWVRAKKRPDAGVERVASVHEASDSVCQFRVGFARQAVALWGLDANDCTFNSNTVAESRFEIVNPTALNANP
jgi:hypothetical protein